MAMFRVGDSDQLIDVVVSEESQRALREAVDSLLSEDSAKSKKVKSLARTGNTISNSLSEIVEYFSDDRDPLWTKDIEYDPSQDRIVCRPVSTELGRCVASATAADRLSGDDVYNIALEGSRTYLSIPDLVKSSRVSPFAKAVTQVFKQVLKPGSKRTFYVSGEGSASRRVLEAAFATGGIRTERSTGFVRAEDIFYRWQEPTPELISAQHIGLLCIDQLETMPKGRAFLTLAPISFVSFIKKRNEEGLLTFLGSKFRPDDLLQLVEFSAQDREILRYLLESETRVLPHITDLDL